MGEDDGPLGEDDDLSGDEGILRGWVPPDDRLWLHPSEMGRAKMASPGDPARARARRSERRGMFAAAVVGTAALTAAIAAVALTSSSASAPSAQAPHLTSSVKAALPLTRCTPSSSWMAVPTCEAVKRVRSSMLRIVVGNGSSSRQGTAVVVQTKSGGTVAITAAALVGSNAKVKAITSSGKEGNVQVIGVDESSGIAAIRIPWSMPSAPIAQEGVADDQILVLACIGPNSDSLLSAMGQVDSPSSGTAHLVDAITVDISSIASPGGVLLDSTGKVVGILGATNDSSSEMTGDFVPSWLALGVAERLVADHKIVHGWLDLKGTTSSGGGAQVTSVPSKGPAAVIGLRRGDIVIEISTQSGSDPIDSMADLRARLYIEPPGTKVMLTIVRDGQEMLLDPVSTSATP